MVWMYLVSLFGFSFAILSMAEMSSMYVAIGSAHLCMTATDNFAGLLPQEDNIGEWNSPKSSYGSAYDRVL